MAKDAKPLDDLNANAKQFAKSNCRADDGANSRSIGQLFQFCSESDVIISVGWNGIRRKVKKLRGDKHRGDERVRTQIERS